MSTDAITTTGSRLDAGLQERSLVNTDSNFHKIVRLHKLGYSPEDIADECENLTIADVFAALDYYFSNRREVEAELDK